MTSFIYYSTSLSKYSLTFPFMLSFFFILIGLIVRLRCHLRPFGTTQAYPIFRYLETHDLFASWLLHTRFFFSLFNRIF